MANNKIIVTQGVGTNLATQDLVEGGETRHMSRVVMNDNTGVAIPVSLEATQQIIKTSVGNLDVLLSTRLKPADTLAGVTTVTSITNPLPLQTDLTASGNITALSGSLVMALKSTSALSFQITGTFVATLTFQGSNDGTNWFNINAVSSSTSSPQATTTVIGLYRATPAGLSQVRVIATSYTSGTASVIIIGSTGVGGTFVNQILPVRAMLDTNRSSITMNLDRFAVVATTETLNTVSYSSINGTPTTGTSYNVTTAKILRIQSITISLQTSTGNTTAASVMVRLRVNSGGVATVTSNQQWACSVQGINTANNSNSIQIPIPDGYEVAAGSGIGITTTCAGFSAVTAAPIVNVSIIGYEY